MFWIIFPLAVFATVSGFRLDASYRRVVRSLRAMDSSHIEELPPDIFQSLTRFSEILPSLAFSWNSNIFRQVTLGDISWARDLPAWEHVLNTRRRFRVCFIAGAAALAALFIFMLMESKKSEANQPPQPTTDSSTVSRG